VLLTTCIRYGVGRSDVLLDIDCSISPPRPLPLLGVSSASPPARAMAISISHHRQEVLDASVEPDVFQQTRAVLLGPRTVLPGPWQWRRHRQALPRPMGRQNGSESAPSGDEQVLNACCAVLASFILHC